MTEDELADVLEAELSPSAKLLPKAPSLDDRRLEVLRTTFPRWTITRTTDLDGKPVWTARLIRLLTPAMVAAGVVGVIEVDCPYALASALSCQVAILHNSRYVECLPPI